MVEETLFASCPRCGQGRVTWQPEQAVYSCGQCQFTVKERTFLGFFNKGRFGVSNLGEGDYSLAREALSQAVLPPDVLKLVAGNVYTDQQLAAIAGGVLDVIRPVQTTLAQIILEQLQETCYLQVNRLQRGQGPPLSESRYWPDQPAPRQDMNWQDQGNLFCTDQRLVFPSDSFTFIRIDRKLSAVQAFTNGLAVQRTEQDFATYFVGCYPHEAALVAAYIMGKLPALREPESEPTEVKS